MAPDGTEPLGMVGLFDSVASITSGSLGVRPVKLPVAVVRSHRSVMVGTVWFL